MNLSAPSADNAFSSEGGLFSEAYLSIRERFLALKESASPPEADVLRDAPSLSEKTLRVLWYEGRYQRRGLATVDGRRLTVLNPGEWNLDAGPDFLGAEIRLEDGLVRGDVELHLSDRDWQAHGHQRDPAFDGVVLHVFLSPSREPRAILRSNGLPVASVSLEGRLPGPWASLVRGFDPAGYPYASRCGAGECSKKAGPARHGFIARLLALAGDGRILLKSRRGAPDAPGVDPEAAFYRALAESLGYHRNKSAMASLAERLPWAFVKGAALDAPPELRRERLEALFFGAAGLLPAAPPRGDAEASACLKRLLPLWEGLKKGLPSRRSAGRQRRAADESAPVWVYRGVRPSNHPLRRLSGLAAILARLLEAGPAGFFERLVRDSAGPGAAGGAAWFTVPGHGYFARRCRWGGRPSARPVALVGPDRAQAVWVNAFLPLAVRLSRARGDSALEAALHGAYARLPLSEPNGAARLMAHRLFGSERDREFPLIRERQQQGLLQIFQDFCDTKPWACGLCVFPRVMALAEEELVRAG